MSRFLLFLSLVLVFVPGTVSQSAALAIEPDVPGLVVIKHISPATGVVGAAVTVFGSNFGSTQGTSTVTFNGVAASVVKWADWSVIVQVPAGDSSGNVVVHVGSKTSNGIGFKVVTLPTRTTVASDFGFQCGPDTEDCGAPHGAIVWPETQPQPEFLRLHDAGTSWSDLSTGSGTYDWTVLDTWLDAIAKHRPVNVIQVFSWVPCWDAPNCEAPGVAPTGTDAPPNDLTATGSPSFNDFVTQFVQHCSAAGNCAGNCPTGKTCVSTNLIRYYEMWNEWNTQFRWSGSIDQLYHMLAPAVSIIRANVTNSVILTPSTTSGSFSAFQDWLTLETTDGPISDWVAWHNYLWGQTPEYEWTQDAALFLSLQVSLPAWKGKPWADTETNYDVNTYACPDTFSKDNCTGQIVRWQLLHASNGAMSVNWYKWVQTIKADSQYETAYHYMMQYLLGGKFGGPCAPTSGKVWTCSFTESNGTAALWVWTPNQSGASFTVPSGYVDYLDLTGAKTTVSSGNAITVTVEPVMLEQ